MDEQRLQPLSKAVARLEAAVLSPSLPPAVLEANRTAFTSLKDFLSSLSNPNAYPAAGIKSVNYVLPPRRRGGPPERVRCLLKTTGGDCSRLVAANLGALLQRCGIDPYFYFDRDEFNPKPPLPPLRRRPAAPRSADMSAAAEPSLPEVAKVRAEAAAAGFPSQLVSEAEFRELEAKQQGTVDAKAEAEAEVDDWSEKVKRLDPLFGAVAAVPWMPTDADGRERVQYIKATVLDELEAQGWDVRGAAVSIWQGERDAKRLAKGKDAGSAAAVQSLIFHAKKYDDTHGKKVHGN